MTNINFIDREKSKLDMKNSREKALAFSLEELEGMVNNIVYRDSYNNKLLDEMLDDFLNRDIGKDGFLRDNFIQIIDYSIKALKKIINNPKDKLIKTYQLQRANKAVQTDYKTMIWLSGKPGKTLVEKIGVSGNILAPKNNYSIDKKENRIVNFYFKKIYELLEKRIGIYKHNIEEPPKDLINLQKKLYKLKKKLIDSGIYNLKRPTNFEPNNTLIDHRDYSVINRGLHYLNEYIEKSLYSENELLQLGSSIVFLNTIKYISKLKNMKVVNKIIKTKEILNKIDECCEFYIENKEETYSIKIKLNENKIEIKIGTIKFNSTKSYKPNEKQDTILTFKFDIIKDFSKYLKIYCNGIKYNLNQEGLFELTDRIVVNISKKIKENTFSIKKFEKNCHRDVYFNFNSYIPFVNNKQLEYTTYNREYNVYLEKSDYFYLKSQENNLINLNEIMSSQENIEFLSKYLKTIKNQINMDPDIIRIYSSLESLDTNIQRDILSIFNSNFKRSYPIWRSILAAYTIDKKKNWIKDFDEITILDINTKIPSINLVKNKNKMYEHHPPINFNINDITVEKLLEEYLERYLKKYNLKLNKIERKNLISSGKLYDSVINNKKHIIIQEKKIILLERDKNIYKILEKEFKMKIYSHLENYFNKIKIKNKKIIIICDFITDIQSKKEMDIKLIKENDLSLERENIVDRIKNNKEVWNEFLPNLALETIKESHFYNLDLIKDKSINLTLGKEIIFDVEEKLILPAGKDIIHFPLHSEDSLNKRIYSLEVKSENFPLDKPLEVALKISYSYGSKNPYKIIIDPVDENILSESFETKWMENIEELKMKSLEFPKITSTFTKEDSINVIEGIEETAIIRPDNLLNYLKYNRNRFRDYIVQEINNENYGHIKENLLPRIDFLCDILKINQIGDDVKKEARLFLGSFGALINYKYPLTFKEKHTPFKRKKALFFYKFNNKKFSEIYNNKDDQIETISEAAWLDNSFMNGLVKNEPEVIDDCLIKIKTELFDLNTDFYKEFKSYPFNKLWKITNKYRDYLEFILAILMSKININLPKKDIFTMIYVIKSIDRKIQLDSKYLELKKVYDKDSRIKFEVSKKDDLKNMSDLAYTVYNLITGDDGSDSIKIKEYKSE